MFRDRTAGYTSTMLDRLFTVGGANPVGLTTASEFGGLNVSTTKLNGITHNPWQQGRTAGGSSGGSAAAVAGGLVPIASGGDGGGSIRIPAGFNGLLGMKGTVGRIPRGPKTMISPAHGRRRLPGPVGARRRPLVRRHAPATTAATRTRCRASRAGSATSAPTSTPCGASGW